ncbi:MAG: alpha-hydroxy-acid oxidizing protein, partial [Desulfamplus sp.]|nr:alpha-hydroxy-acid oxidizing protein [Desulfamplus sp.]
MATIDLSTLPIRSANEVIRGYGAAHQDIEIINPDARHYIAVGLTNPVKVSIKGSAGYFCGGLCDGPRIEVSKNVSWGVGDNMLSGTIVVGGNAGAIAGEALRGGTIIIKGNMGSRSGQVMKKGTLCCLGNASFMAGYMMYGGTIIILGNSGQRVGENMAGGEIYVGGTITSLGSDAMVTTPSAEESDSVLSFLSTHGISFSGTFQKVISAGKDLSCGSPQPSMKPIPFTSFSSQDSPWWNVKVQQDIQLKSRMGRSRVRGYGTSRPVPHFDDIGFRKPLMETPWGEGGPCPRPQGVGHGGNTARYPDLRTFIGGRNGARPLDLSMPVLIAPMSLGALGPKVKVALGIASRLSGICENTGEGGMYSLERAQAHQLIAQCLSGRLGWNIHDMRRSDALELYISQGAKPGLGGQLMAAKLTREIAELRGIPQGMDLRSPSRHPDVLGGDDLIMKVMELREAVGWRIPVSLKLGGGRTRDDVKIAYKDGIDFVELDGLQGGTGAGSGEVIEYVGIPTISALMEAMDGLDEIDARDKLPMVIMGGIRNGVDGAKAIALGATAVAVGTPLLVAAGCTGCMECSSGECPVGIATQNPELGARFDVEKRALAMHSYLESFRWQLSTITAGLGYSSIQGLKRDDLVALTPEAAELTRLPFAPEYGISQSFPRERGREKSETGSATFSRSSRRIVRQMSRTDGEDIQSQSRILDMALQGRPNPFPKSRGAHFDDVVFLSAALTRLVIDPYREECSTRTTITRTMEIGGACHGSSLDDAGLDDAGLDDAGLDGAGQSGDYVGSKGLKKGILPRVTLKHPFIFTGFDGAPQHVRASLGAAIKMCGCAYMGRGPLIENSWTRESGDCGGGTRGEADVGGGTRGEADGGRGTRGEAKGGPIWFQLILAGDTPSRDASALIYLPGKVPISSMEPQRCTPDQLVGICADRKNLPEVVPH